MMLPPWMLLLAATIEAKEAWVNVAVPFPAPSAVASHHSLPTQMAGNNTNKPRSNMPVKFKPNPDEPIDNPKQTMYSWSYPNLRPSSKVLSSSASQTKASSSRATKTKPSSTKASSTRSSAHSSASTKPSTTSSVAKPSTKSSSSVKSSSSIKPSSSVKASSSVKPSSSSKPSSSRKPSSSAGPSTVKASSSSKLSSSAKPTSSVKASSSARPTSSLKASSSSKPSSRLSSSARSSASAKPSSTAENTSIIVTLPGVSSISVPSISIIEPSSTPQPSSSSARPSSSVRPSSSTSSSASTPSGTPLQSWSLPYTTKLSTIPSVMSAIKGTWGWPKNYAGTIIATPPVSDRSAAGSKAGSWSAQNTGNGIRASYPKGSLTPSNSPLGGINFYASPLDLSNAYNVSFEYSVFFPEDFDFVLGGKLPGLYGGHTACSGGSSADDCFSARMMWRTGGLGELYLYAPRAHQTTSLCTTKPLTYCGTTDGMSIGRGAFSFTKGGWTHIRQDIWMNTPGVADGGFNIWVDGKLVISNSQTYFRSATSGTTNGAVKTIPRMLLFDSSPKTGFTEDLPSLDGEEPPFAAASACIDSLPNRQLYENGAAKAAEPALPNPKLSAYKQTFNETESASTYSTWKSDEQSFSGIRLARRAPKADIVEDVAAATIPAVAPASSFSNITIKAVSSALGSDATRNPNRPWTFRGIQHMTFFGGSSDKWRSPKLQYTYFNDWSMAINS